jgi:hypothetical protein
MTGVLIKIAQQMVNKVNLISSIHVAVLTNVEEAKKKKQKACICGP